MNTSRRLKIKVLPGHPFHDKSDAELLYLYHDARDAAHAMRDHDARAEAKYLDQVNDACTIMHARAEARRAIAVNKAIAASNRSGRRIGRREAAAIHAVLKPR